MLECSYAATCTRIILIDVLGFGVYFVIHFALMRKITSTLGIYFAYFACILHFLAV